jgi:hypothetical protein
MLREILDNADTKTHRNIIRKDRTVFVIAVPHGASISPQLYSRAHEIL